MASSLPASLFIPLDSRLHEGLQQQIYASIRRAILDGVVVPGMRLPSSRALAGDLGVTLSGSALTGRVSGLALGAKFFGAAALGSTLSGEA
jgi:alpha-D-ribose 1-methylphosphonate 5-phosphate C-P lyase